MAIDEQRQSLNFAQYRERCERVAAGLQALGVTADARVSWPLPTCLDTLVLFGALARLQAVQIPLVPLYRDHEMSFVLGQTSSRVVVVPGRWRGYDYAAMARRVAGRLTGPITILISDEGLPEGDPATLAGTPLPSTQPGQDPVRWIYYTSGSTADPKGVLHSDGTLGTVAAILVDRLHMRADDRSAMVFPFSHIGGSNLLLSALMVGCRCICVESFDPLTTVDFLAEEGVTLAGAGTVFHTAYLAAQRRTPDRPIFPSVRAFPGGGAPKPAHLHYEVKDELGGPGSCPLSASPSARSCPCATWTIPTTSWPPPRDGRPLEHRSRWSIRMSASVAPTRRVSSA